MTADQPEPLLARLRRLEEKATPGPWNDDAMDEWCYISGEKGPLAQAWDKTDAELIVTLRNEAIAEIERLTRERDELARRVTACFDEDGTVPLDDGTGDRYFAVSAAGQKRFISGIATLPLQELHAFLSKMDDGR